jgi:hypothetical protein
MNREDLILMIAKRLAREEMKRRCREKFKYELEDSPTALEKILLRDLDKHDRGFIEGKRDKLLKSFEGLTKNELYKVRDIELKSRK